MATMVAGCALKTPPDAAAIKEQALPALQVPAQWTAAGAGAGAVADNWLATFRDDQLTAAVAEAIAHNADLRVGAARVEQAQLYAKLAGAKLYPSVDLLARGGGKLSGDGSGLQGGVLTATWELDLWGRVRYGRAASAAQAASAEADFEYARQSIAALVAKSWFLATEAGLQVEAARETIRGERGAGAAGRRPGARRGRRPGGRLRRARRRRELSRRPAPARARTRAGDSRARAPARPLSRRPRRPSRRSCPASPARCRPGCRRSSWSGGRTSIAAERRVAAAFNRIGEAKAARLPAISLTTGVSAISSELFVLKDHDNPVWNVGANLLAPIFRGGALKTQVEIRTAEQKQAIAEYAAVGLRAFGEVEDALAAEIAAREREQILAQALADNQQALERGADPVQGGQHRSQVRRAAAAGADRHALRAHPRAGRAARAAREPPPRARRQLRAAARAPDHSASRRHPAALALRTRVSCSRWPNAATSTCRSGLRILRGCRHHRTQPADKHNHERQHQLSQTMGTAGLA